MAGSKPPQRMTEEQRAMVEQWAPLARWAMRRFPTLTGGLRNHGMTWDEIEQTAMLGIMRAAMKYDPTRGTAFTTYAVASIRGSWRQEYSELSRHKRRRPTLGGIEAFHRDGPSVPDPNDSGGEDRVFKRVGLIAPSVSRYYRKMTHRDSRRDAEYFDALTATPELSEQTEKALAQLGTQERDIITARFGLYADRETLVKVAAKYGVSKQRILQIQRRAIAKLRDILDTRLED